MPKLTRRLALMGTSATVAAPALLSSRGAQSAEFAYKYSNDLTANHPTTLRMAEAANRIRKETGGRLDIQIFPDSQLGSTTATLTQLRSGALEFLTYSPAVFSSVVPVTAITAIGFAFPDYPTVWKAMDGELGAFIRAAITKENIVVMENCWDQGFRQISSSTRPILKPADLEGFKIRVPVSPLWTSMFKAFGAAPISLNVSELYSALQTKIAEGTEAPLASLWLLKTYEVQKHFSLTSHMWDGLWFFANKAAWQRLPDDVRTVAAKHINQSALDQRKDLEEQSVSARAKLEAAGIIFHDVNKADFREKLRKAGFFADWKKKLGDEPWALLEKYSGSIS
jgi:tripartite ATP-independent transporter DctP family solute receptor